MLLARRGAKCSKVRRRSERLHHCWLAMAHRSPFESSTYGPRGGWNAGDNGLPGLLPIARRGAKCSHHGAESEHPGAFCSAPSKEHDELNSVCGVVAPAKGSLSRGYPLSKVVDAASLVPDQAIWRTNSEFTQTAGPGGSGQTRDLAKYLSAAVITTKTQAVALVAGKSGGRVAVADIEAYHPVDNGRLSSLMLIAVHQDAKRARCWLRAIRRARLRFG